MTPNPTPRDGLDAFGAAALTGFALLLAFNQVVIAVGGDGWQPVFMAALRSLGAALVLWLWVRISTGSVASLAIPRAAWGAVVALGVCFATEFTFLFTALDLTTVGRASVIFYAMPFWAALGGQIFLGERITPLKLAGLLAAFAGMAWAILDGSAGEAGQATLIGDLCAVGASIMWAATLIVVKASRARDLPAMSQLFWQVTVSAPLLLLAAPFFGPLIRDLAPIHWWSLGFQAFVVASFGFVFWFWLLKLYPASTVASFSFLSPIFAVGLGALLLGEDVGPGLAGALALVTLGLILANRPQKPRG